MVLPATRSGVVAVVIATLLVSGCGASPPSPSDPVGSTSAPTSSAASGGGATGKGGGTTGGTDSTDTAYDETSTPDPGPDDGSSAGTGGVSTSEGGSGLEMPATPEPSTESLADLLDQQSNAPLVTSPLPAAASASGRLAPGYPEVLRPVRSTVVESSSISPAGRRLQVALVGTTRLRPDQVLLALRARLTRRGLAEQPAPVAAPDSSAIAFRGGRSVITINVTPAGAGTEYLIDASLHAGGE